MVMFARGVFYKGPIWQLWSVLVNGLNNHNRIPTALRAVNPSTMGYLRHILCYFSAPLWQSTRIRTKRTIFLDKD